MTPILRGGTVILDAEGLSRLISRDPYMYSVLEEATANRVPVTISAVTLVEVIHPKINRAALVWSMFRLQVEPVTKELSYLAADLLQTAGKHGHTHALDAIVCATALAAQGHATIYTSDPGDIEALVAGRATVVPLH